MFHNLLNNHPMFSQIGIGVVHMCVNRFTGHINYAVYYPEGYKEKLVVTGMDWPAFFTARTMEQALEIAYAAESSL